MDKLSRISELVPDEFYFHLLSIAKLAIGELGFSRLIWGTRMSESAMGEYVVVRIFGLLDKGNSEWVN